ncbi:uricase-like [Asterias rubens]|uniref:uricase-like n=1 Tax=Asterias rubens TaxID=7604 RepID=UPI00145530C4|nr:uricase-like [Asterias rubens]
MANGHFTDVDYVLDGTNVGKTHVRLLQHRRLGAHKHEIQELLVNTSLSWDTHKEFEHSDNSDVIPTDSQKNTVYAQAKIIGITTPEQFAIALCEHFLKTYSQVVRAEIYVEQAPWRRMDQSGEQHAHAFIQTQEATRYCVIRQERDELPTVWGGLKNMKIMKTTQSGFAGFVRDEFTSLPDTTDRIFCTDVWTKWRYSVSSGIDFDETWKTCKESILNVFAGSPDTGDYSPSIQRTMYLSVHKMLEMVSQIDEIELEMPNVHYFLADIMKLGMKNDGEVMMPTGYPHGMIRLAVRRPTGDKV